MSYKPFHRSGLATVCPITTRAPKYPGEVPVPDGHAGQTKDRLILVHQLRTIDLRRVTALEVGGAVQYVTSGAVRGLCKQRWPINSGWTFRLPRTAPPERQHSRQPRHRREADLRRNRH